MTSQGYGTYDAYGRPVIPGLSIYYNPEHTYHTQMPARRRSPRHRRTASVSDGDDSWMSPPGGMGSMSWGRRSNRCQCTDCYAEKGRY
jgi:hypothetical protein